jgi:hypothetical protein
VLYNRNDRHTHHKCVQVRLVQCKGDLHSIRFSFLQSPVRSLAYVLAIDVNVTKLPHLCSKGEAIRVDEAQWGSPRCSRSRRLIWHPPILSACRAEGGLRAVETETALTVVDRAQRIVKFILIACLRKVKSDEVNLLQIRAFKGSSHVRARHFSARSNLRRQPR